MNCINHELCHMEITLQDIILKEMSGNVRALSNNLAELVLLDLGESLRADLRTKVSAFSSVLISFSIMGQQDE